MIAQKVLLSCISCLYIPIMVWSQNFTDVSNTIGIIHTYEQSRHMGGGAVFFDYDNDGWEDLYMTSGNGIDKLYKNLENGNFQEITDVGFEITADFYTTAAVSGDFNNDGYRDLIVVTWGGDVNSFERSLLFMNDGDGTFTESAMSYGITDTSFSMGVATLDYNNDGYLDIYVVNYVDNVAIDYSTGNVINDDCFPNLFYINNGNGTFSEISASLNLDSVGCALAVMPTDYDQDDDQDIYIANDFGAYIISNRLLNNNYSNSNDFTDLSSSTNMDIGVFAMGISYADIDKDQDYDYYITNLGRNVLIENNGSQNFTDIATTAGVENTHTSDSPGDLFTTGWGTAFLDVNNDTWPDLFVANGRVPAHPAIGTGETDPNKLYLNNGDSTFTDITVSAGIGDTNRGRGMAYCDYDKDGDLDVVVVVQDESADVNAKTTFYQNQLNPTGSDGNNWVQFQLEGVNINRDAIGAKVEITVNGETLIQEVHGQGSHCSQHSLVLHFGLGTSTNIEEVKVIWSNSDTQTFTNVDVNQRYNLIQGDVLGNENSVSSNKIKFYPNPVTNNTLYVQGLKYETTITVLSITGQIVKEFNFNQNSDSINVSDLRSGLYIFKYKLENNTYKNELVIKR